MRTLLSLLFILAAQTCSDIGEELEKTDFPFADYSGTFTGVLPCPDCLGISATLHVNNDGSYARELTYLGKSGQARKDSGSFKLNADSTIQITQSPVMKIRPVEAGWSVVQLEGVEEGLPSILKPKGSLSGNKEDEGFVGRGNEPFWRLSIVPGENISIRVLDGDSATTPVPEPISNENGKELIYETETGSTSLRIAISEEECFDSMSGERFTHSVNVELNGRELKGCGRFTPGRPPYGSYKLIELEGKQVPDDLRKGTPEMRIEPGGNRASGHTGCNQFNTTVRTDAYGSLEFNTPMAMTKMMCPGDFESRFTGAMKRVNGFALSSDTLDLLTGGRVIMRWETVSNRQKK